MLSRPRDVARSDPQIRIIGRRVCSCLSICVPDLQHRRLQHYWIRRRTVVGLEVVDAVDDLGEVVAELACAVRLVAALEVGDQPRDHGVAGAQEDRRRAGPVVVEGAQDRDRGRD